MAGGRNRSGSEAGCVKERRYFTPAGKAGKGAISRIKHAKWRPLFSPLPD